MCSPSLKASCLQAQLAKLLSQPYIYCHMNISVSKFVIPLCLHIPCTGMEYVDILDYFVISQAKHYTMISSNRHCIRPSAMLGLGQCNLTMLGFKFCPIRHQAKRIDFVCLFVLVPLALAHLLITQFLVYITSVYI